jgi:uncharacterized protein
MNLEGAFVVARPAAEVWAALNDPAVLAGAIPGCESLTATATGYDATIQLKVGPVKARFSGQVKIAAARAPERLVLTGEGSGGVAGFARGEAGVDLRAVEGGTEVRYTAEVAIGGKLAQLGNRLIASTARKLAEQFFATLNATLSTESEVQS